ncbi:MAG: carbohydrate kinase [Planctomycetes bacterium]|nr:carbohydrate kinase [Planctomycetota bacterium]
MNEPMQEPVDVKELGALVPRLRGRKVMVVGDLLVDRYVLTEPARLSREAPVMIARYQAEELIPGGAANAASNLLALGAEVIPVGVVGDDADGDELRSHFDGLGVDVTGIITDPEHPTISKTRVMVGDPNRMKQQVLRIDRDPDGPPSGGAQAAVLARIRDRIASVDAVLLSDYGYGAVGASVLDSVRGIVGDRVLTVDSRYRITSFRGVTLATPNEGEVAAALGRRLQTMEQLEDAGHELRSRLEAPALLVTRGNRGMALFVEGRDRLDLAATGPSEVTDVSGAGDTVIAVATLALAAGADVSDAARLANIAAGVVVMKAGAATCSPQELTEAAAAWA